MNRLTAEERAALRTVKAIGTDRVGVYQVLWGGPEDRDLDGEYFTKNTAELLAVCEAMGKIPMIYHHGMDEGVKAAPVGVWDTWHVDDVGVWMAGQLDKANEYESAVKQLIAAGKLGASSGCLPAARKVSPEGEILRWPIVEGSLTTTPSNWHSRVDYPVEAVKAAYREAGLVAPALEGLEELKVEQGAAGQEPVADSAPTPPVPTDEPAVKAMSLGEQESLVRDTLRKALNGGKAEGDQGWRWFDTWVYPTYVVYERDGGYFQRDYTILNGAVTLSDSETAVVRGDWTPVKAYPDLDSLCESGWADHTEAVLAAVEGWRERLRWQRPNKQAVKAGRVLSAVNRGRLQAVHDRIGECHKELRGMLDEADMGEQMRQRAMGRAVKLREVLAT